MNYGQKISKTPLGHLQQFGILKRFDLINLIFLRKKVYYNNNSNNNKNVWES